MDCQSDSSDSANEDCTATNVLLGYASSEPTEDTISRLGGLPSWLAADEPPAAAFARCKTCNDYMSLLIQLHADLPTHFPHHERRLHVFECRRKTCRRKEGSVRALRTIRADPSAARPEPKGATLSKSPASSLPPPRQLGNDIFDTMKSASSSGSSPNANPFSMSTSAGDKTALSMSNPFSTSTTHNAPSSAANPRTATDLPMSFSEKMRLSSASSAPSKLPPAEPWPSESVFPEPYPAYYLDADYELLETPQGPAWSSRGMEADISSTSMSNEKDEVDGFESSIDKTFQRFAERLAQNPDQVLRYEFRGAPLLSSKTDAVGVMLAAHQPSGPPKAKSSSSSSSSSSRPGRTGIPNCNNCGACRVFEMQLTPQAITELEAREEGLDGMEWGTVIVGVCEKDCEARDVESGKVGYVEEWVGVQWEERRR